MNGSTAKLLRRYSHISGHPYRDLKRIYKRIPRPERFATKQEIRADIDRLKKLKNRHSTKATSPEPATQKNKEPQAPETVPPAYRRTPSRAPVEKPAWWQAVWGWIKAKLKWTF